MDSTPAAFCFVCHDQNAEHIVAFLLNGEASCTGPFDITDLKLPPRYNAHLDPAFPDRYVLYVIAADKTVLNTAIGSVKDIDRQARVSAFVCGARMRVNHVFRLRTVALFRRGYQHSLTGERKGSGEVSNRLDG